MPTSPATELVHQTLLASVRLVLGTGQAEQLTQLAEQAIDWALLRDVAQQHEVLPMVYDALQATVPEHVPANVLQTMRHSHEINTLRNLMMTGELVTISNALGEAGILAAALKGPALGAAVYDKPGLRVSRDLDIILDESRLQQALEIIYAHGYTLYSTSNHHHNLVNANRTNCIELHWRFAQQAWLPLDFANYANKLETMQLGGSTLHVLAPPDRLSYLCMHGHKHRWQRLKWLCDLTAFVVRHPDLEWETLLEQPQSLKFRRMAYLGLRLAHSLLNAPVPAHVLAWADADPVTGPLAARAAPRYFENYLSAPELDDTYRLARISSPQEGTWQYLRDMALWPFKPKRGDRENLRLPRHLHFLYYPLRLFRVLFVPSPRRIKMLVGVVHLAWQEWRSGQTHS